MGGHAGNAGTAVLESSGGRRHVVFCQSNVMERSCHHAICPVVQAALFKRLSTDEELNGRVTGVFDAVPKDQQKPYVTMGDDDVSPFKTKTSSGEEINVVLHCWSGYNGKRSDGDSEPHASSVNKHTNNRGLFFMPF